MRLQTLALFFLLLASQAITAKDFYLDFDNAYYDSWDWNFEVDSIIDARENKELMGFAYKGFPKRKRVAYLKKPLADELKPIFAEAPKTVVSSRKIILRVNHLYVYESRKDGHYGLAEANVSFIEKTDTGYTELFQAGRYFSIEGLSMAKWHPQNILDVLGECFSDFERRQLEGRLQPKAITKNELSSNPYLLKRPYPIEKAYTLPKGLYHSFYDFRDNLIDPSTTFYPEYFDSKKGLRKATIEIINQKMDPEQVYAFSDGKSIFIRGGKKFYEILDSNQNFYLSQHAISYDGYGGGMMLSGILLGPLGVALYAASNTPQGAKEGYFLNLDFGEVLPANLDEAKAINGEVLIYNSDFNDSTKMVEVSINGEPMCNLGPDKVYRYEASLKSETINLCAKYRGQEVCIEIKHTTFHTDLYLIRFNRKDELDLNQVTTAMKESVLNDVKTREIPQVCD